LSKPIAQSQKSVALESNKATLAKTVLAGDFGDQVRIVGMPFPNDLLMC
jgi:hypothetical protein